VACPCALGLATPTAVTVGIGRMSEFGILVKNSESLEIASNINTVVFDKTGTITEGKLIVEEVIPFNTTQKEVLEIATTLEENSTHPIAKAIIQKSKKWNW
jgi:Cu+-exporting ATPase